MMAKKKKLEERYGNESPFKIDINDFVLDWLKRKLKLRLPSRA